MDTVWIPADVASVPPRAVTRPLIIRWLSEFYRPAVIKVFMELGREFKAGCAKKMEETIGLGREISQSFLLNLISALGETNKKNLSTRQLMSAAMFKITDSAKLLKPEMCQNVG